jgi:formate dehydrogenase major subunit
MKKLSINIDGKERTGFAGQTILDVARENDVFIPTLCYDGRTEIYGACGLCVVEAEGNPKLLKACATEIAEGMIIRTGTPRVVESRKTMLELLLSNHAGDCRPPCVLACPAQTDCQGYVGLVANGKFAEALELVKEKIPLPASIGRVCPHPCEDKCRRGLVDEPVGIAWIKRFAGDLDLEEGVPWIPDIAEETGKSVAVVGGGPYGLSLAYFLRRMGHGATIYEAMPKAGGMLRYGIPEYRLPKAVVDREIEVIEAMGVEIVTDTRVGKDISFDLVRAAHDAVALGIGAWLSTGTGAKGENLPGVVGGIDLLRKVARGEEVFLGERVAIVGGGNTAMDACRTAVRMGAKEVYNIYRRTKAEMPADLIEIEEAEEEGVIFKNLTNPIEILPGKDGRVAKITLQIMELGEPDASGRRAPTPVKGKTETIAVDTVVLAIGQAVDPLSLGVAQLELTRKNGIVFDTETFRTSIPGVFAGGDCGNDKISIAIEAIADAKRAAGVINAYLFGETASYRPNYVVERDDITERTFESRERECRPDMGVLSPEARRGSFAEVVFGWDEDAAMQEGMRCLECGCGDYFECKLYEYANLYDVDPARFAGDFSVVDEGGRPKAPDATDDGHPMIVREEGKCILCGLCVRVCEEVVGASALGLVGRGFDTVVKPTLMLPLEESGCVSCGQCVSVCPTGALQERLSLPKSVPLATKVTETTCPHCSVGCAINLETYGDLLVKANPAQGGASKGLVCGRGKFGFDCSELEGRLEDPLVRDAASGALEPAPWYDAFVASAKKAQSVAAKYGPGSVAVSVSDRFSNEEVFAIRTLAGELGARVFSFNNRVSAAERVFGALPPADIEELAHTDFVLAAGYDFTANPVVNMKLKQAAGAGAKIVFLATDPDDARARAGYPAEAVRAANSLKLLTEIAAGVLALNPGRLKNRDGFKALEASLKGVKVSAKAQKIAEDYCGAKKAMVVYQQNVVTEQAAELLCEIALLAGRGASPRDGVLALAPKCNSRGLWDLGISGTAADILAPGAGADGKVGAPTRALLIFGEDPAGQIAAAEAAGAAGQNAAAAAGTPAGQTAATGAAGFAGQTADGAAGTGVRQTAAEAADASDGTPVGQTAATGTDVADGSSAAASASAGAQPLPEELKAAAKLLRQAEFVMVCDTHLTATAAAADVVVPAGGFASTDGTYTNTEGRLVAVSPATESAVEYAVWEVAREIANVCEAGIGWEDEGDLSRELNDESPAYRYSVVGETLRPDFAAARTELFAAPASGKFVSAIPTSDNLTRMINQRLGEWAYGL